MPLNISIFPPVRNAGAVGSASCDVHNFSSHASGVAGAHSVLAASTDSAAIVGPCQLVLIPDEGQRVVLTKGAAAGADPAVTGMKLVAGGARAFDLGAGNWFVRWIAG